MKRQREDQEARQMMCRLCKRHTGYPERIMLTYGRGLRSYAHLACYLEKEDRPAAEKWFRWQTASRLRSLVDHNAAELRELGLFEFASALAQERERLVAERDKPGTPTAAQLDLAIEIAEGLQKGVVVKKRKPGDRLEDGEVLTAEDIAKAEGIVALGYGIAERLQEPDASSSAGTRGKPVNPPIRKSSTVTKKGGIIHEEIRTREGGFQIIGAEGFRRTRKPKP